MTMTENGNGTMAAAQLPDVLQFMQLLWAVVHGLDARPSA
jgi:hypothetical protein